MAYKKLIKVSNVCQLLDKSKYNPSQTINGVTFTNNGDGTITVNGAASANTIFNIQNIGINRIKSGTTIYLNTTNYRIIKDNVLFEYSSYSPSNGWCYFFIPKGGVVENLVAKPQLFDLTEMYGAGHEPTTVEQFRQDFPEEMYDYSPHCWLTSYKRVILTGAGNYLTSYQRNLTCKTKNLLPYPYYDGTKTVNGVTFTDNGNGTINLSGTSTKQANYYFSYGTLNLKKGVTYTLSASGDYSCSGSFNFYIYNSTYGHVCDIYLTSSNKAKSFTPSQDINGINCYIVVPADRTVSGIFKPMLELGDTATDYVPYGHL